MEEYKKLICKSLDNYFSIYEKNAMYSEKIWHAMRYTTLLEGKRLRGIMCLETAKIFNAPIENIIPTACALEIMHAYSLIHDDLPCMDNDDLRRGKPSNHKVFGEAAALLAGDALISFGAQLIIEQTPKSVPLEIILEIVNGYLRCAGALGIIAGQIADIEAENKKIETDNLKYIHKYKTGALFKYSILSGAKIANADNKKIELLTKYADNFGILFQIYDDIIDCTLSTKELGKTAGKDKLENKLTYVSAYGLDEAKNIFSGLIKENYAILDKLNIKSQIFDKINNTLMKKIGVSFC